MMINLELPDPLNGPVCPTNGKPGKRVDTLTLKALLNLPLTEIRATQYRFCPDPDCPTVYYSEEGRQLFEEGALREPVFQKHPDEDEVFICYCFRHTIAAVRSDVREHSNPSIPAAITAGVQADQCACDIRNPQGNCCLGNVNALVKRLQTDGKLQ